MSLWKDICANLSEDPDFRVIDVLLGLIDLAVQLELWKTARVRGLKLETATGLHGARSQ